PPSDIEVGERPVRVVGSDPDGLHRAAPAGAAVGVGPAARGQTDTEQTGDDDRPYLHAAADFEPLAAFTAKRSSDGTTRQAAITSGHTHARDEPCDIGVGATTCVGAGLVAGAVPASVMLRSWFSCWAEPLICTCESHPSCGTHDEFLSERRSA